MGTEVKIAENLINYENSIFNGTLSILLVETIKANEKKNLKNCSLFTLTSDNNSKVGYRIRTEFDSKT
jgi:hypothetical protein